MNNGEGKYEANNISTSSTEEPVDTAVAVSKAEPESDPVPAQVAEERRGEPSEISLVPSKASEDKSAATFERERTKLNSSERMEDSEKPAVTAEYQSFDDVSVSGPPPTYESSRGDGGSSALPSRYQRNTEADSNLAIDLQQTASGCRRTRRTTRRTPHYKIDADSDAGSDDSTVDEDYEVASIMSSIEEGLTWRGRMQYALHNHYFHIVIVVLVCLDALIVMFELLLDVGAFNNRVCYGETPIEQSEFCHYDSRELCGPLAIQILEHRNITPFHGSGEEDLCVCRYRFGKFVCDRADEPLGVNPALILHIFSLVILTIFLFEIILKIVAFRLKYFTHKFEVFDGIVVVVSWVLDVASIVEEEAFEAAALIIVLRLWRVVRIVNGAVLSSKAQSDRKLEDARAEARRIIHAFHKCQDKVDQLEEEKAKLLKQAESHDDTFVKRPLGTC